MQTLPGRTALVASSLLVTLMAGSANASVDGVNQRSLLSKPVEMKELSLANKPNAGRVGSRVFQPERGLTGEHVYIITLAEPALAAYTGGVRGLARTAVDTRRGERKLNARSPASRAYVQYLRGQQDKFLSRTSRMLGRSAAPLNRYVAAVNGVSLRMTQAEAQRVARLSGVAMVERSVEMQLDTDAGPNFIGAPQVWSGEATGEAALGEGIIVGIIDSGINGDHPSFASAGSDGYEHTNPYGDGVYVGECFDTPDLVCSSKLIGRYNFTQGSNPPAPTSEDTDGHGTHVASTAAGNFVDDVPFFDAEGNPTGFSVNISGVAPHANLIAYSVCAPLCPSSDVLNAIDQAILDGVDVLNKSISSPPGSPWEASLSLGALNARAAGISFAISAGNDGPGVGTVAEVNGAPWNGAVAASTHDRAFPTKTLGDFGGGDTPPMTITGRSLSPGYTGPIVYAGDYANGDPDPEQCLNAFPPGTWTNGEIVVCDRGAIARVQKCINVRDGGAAGCVLTNVPGGATSVADDPHVIPAIHIAEEDGTPLKAWLASGSGHSATIGEGGAPFSDPEAGDIMADFSSRGPYTGFDFLSPNVSAPGVSIYAAFADGIEYAFLGGTSMSSPHVAGSMALLRQTRPDWTDAEILSALMSTGVQEMRKEDGVTPADAFDFGGGRVRVNEAANASLLFDETAAGFEAANPATGGDPKDMNIASFANDACLSLCSWERTVEATVSDTWSSSSNGDFPVTVEPASFSLNAGETQVITVTADVSAMPNGEFAFAELVLTPAGGANPPTELQVAVTPSAGDLPNELIINTGRDAGSVTETIASIEVTDLQVEAFGLSKGDTERLAITGETGEFDPYDQPDGVGVSFFEVPADAIRVIVRTFDSEAPDADLFVGRDDNGDGDISADEERCNSGTGGSDEFCEVADVEGGTWWAAVINFTASEPDATDETSVNATAVAPSTGNFFAEGPGGPVDELDPYDLSIFYDLDDAEAGDIYYGNLILGSGPGNEGDIGNIPVTLVRGTDDVAIEVDAMMAEVGDTLNFTVTVQPNATPEDLAYAIETAIPDGFSLDEDSVAVTAGEVTVNGDSIDWSVVQASIDGATNSYTVTTSAEDAACTMPEVGQGGGYIDLAAFGFEPSDTEGDTITGTFGLDPEQVNFYGSDRGSLTFTDDGFVFFEGSPGANPWINQSIPSLDDPNDLSAIFWRDMEMVSSPSDGPEGERGVTAITLTCGGEPCAFLVEFDNLEPWPAGDTSDRIDYEAWYWGIVDDAPGAYEIIYAYDNISGFADGVGTIGVEGPDGSIGTQAAFNDVAISDGDFICFDLVGVTFDPAVLTFSVSVDPSAAGRDVETTVTSVVDNAGSEAETASVSVSVGGEFIDSDEDGIADADDNCTLIPNESQCDSDGDGFGNHCDADFNDDGFVFFQDSLLFRDEGFGNPSEPPEYSEYDLNCDGAVDDGDIEIGRTLFRAAPGPAGEL